MNIAISYREYKTRTINDLCIVKHEANIKTTLNILFRLHFSHTYYNDLSDHAVKKSA